MGDILGMLASTYSRRICALTGHLDHIDDSVIGSKHFQLLATDRAINIIGLLDADSNHMTLRGRCWAVKKMVKADICPLCLTDFES